MILESLKQLHGFADVCFDNRIEKNDLLSLRSCMISEVLPSALIRHVEAQQKADACFDQQNYTAAWTSRDQMRNYLDFYFNEFESRVMLKHFLEADLKVIWGIMIKANSSQVKLLIQLKQYEAAEECAVDPIGWIDPGISPDDQLIALGWMDPLLHPKLSLVVLWLVLLKGTPVTAQIIPCRSLASIAQGNTGHGTWLVKQAVEYLHNNELYASQKQQDLFEEFYWAIDDHHERGRFPCKSKASPQRLRVKYWQRPIGCLSFWKWLNISENSTI